MATEFEFSTLNALVVQHGIKGVVEGLAALAQQRADQSQGAQAAIWGHDARQLRGAVPHLWHVGVASRMPQARQLEAVVEIPVPSFLRRAP